MEKVMSTIKVILIFGLAIIGFFIGWETHNRANSRYKAETLCDAVEMALGGMRATIKQDERGVVWVKIENREWDKSTTSSAYHFKVVRNKNEEIIVNEFDENGGHIMFKDAKCELLKNFVKSYL